MLLFQRPALAVKIHDGRKRSGVETGASDKRAVDIFLRHQPLDIVGLDAAPVQNPQLLPHPRGKRSYCKVTQKTMRLGWDLRAWP